LYVQRRLASSVGEETHRGKSQKPRSLIDREVRDLISRVQ